MSQSKQLEPNPTSKREKKHPSNLYIYYLLAPHFCNNARDSLWSECLAYLTQLPLLQLLFFFSCPFPLLPRGARATKIFGPTLQLFNKSPGTLQRRSFTNLRVAQQPALNAPRPRYSLDSQPRAVSSDFELLKMAFASSQPGAGFGGGQSANVQLGPELQEIQTQVWCT